MLSKGVLQVFHRKYREVLVSRYGHQSLRVQQAVHAFNPSTQEAEAELRFKARLGYVASSKQDQATE